MPKNEVSNLITDQEIAFVHLILSGNMTDQRAAEAVGLNPKTAAYIKSKSCVRAYMLEHVPVCSSNSQGRKRCPASTWAASKSWTASGNSQTSDPK